MALLVCMPRPRSWASSNGLLPRLLLSPQLVSQTGLSCQSRPTRLSVLFSGLPHSPTELAVTSSGSHLRPLARSCVPTDESHPATVGFLTSTPLSVWLLRLERFPFHSPSGLCSQVPLLGGFYNPLHILTGDAGHVPGPRDPGASNCLLRLGSSGRVSSLVSARMSNPGLQWARPAPSPTATLPPGLCRSRTYYRPGSLMWLVRLSGVSSEMQFNFRDVR